MERLIEKLPFDRIDWVFTTEPDSEFWHDKVDEESVTRGFQEMVGDGHPMTAWFDEIKTVNDWDLSFNHGKSDHFLFIFVDDNKSIDEEINVIRNKINNG